MEKEQTFYQELKAKGYTRRQFLKFCGIMGAMLGLHQTGIAQVVNALQTKPRKPVLWFHFQECTCCSESFLRWESEESSYTRLSDKFCLK